MEVDGKPFLPGDLIPLDFLPEDDKKKIVVGPGLRQKADSVVVTKPGVLRRRDPAILWIDSHNKRYIPARGDYVIGLVTAKIGDAFIVDINSSESASLSYLAFEGATKRNRPDVKVGDLVFAKLIVANKDMEPELACIDSSGKSNGMGVISQAGFMIHTSVSLARKILHSQTAILKQLGKSLPFEITVGVNGRIWINGRSALETLAIADAIRSSEHLSNEQTKQIVQKLLNSLSGF